MADALANRLALLQLSAELEQAATHAAATIESGDVAAMAGASVLVAHRTVSLAMLIEAAGRDAQESAERAERAAARGRRTLRGAVREVALDLMGAIGQAIKARR
jgi:hypothetical protein